MEGGASEAETVMMLWIDVDTNKQVGGVDHLKVFINPVRDSGQVQRWRT